MHDLSAELRALAPDAALDAARSEALRSESRQLLSIRRELLVAMYAGVAVLIAGVGLLIKSNLDRIGPVTLLTAILAAALLCYAVAWRARHAGRERSLGEDYVLLLGALLFSTAIGYAEVRFQLFGAGWSRHLLLLALWHLAGAYLFGSRLVLAVALTSLAAWLGVEPRFGSVFESPNAWLGLGPRALLCALLFWIGGLYHRNEGSKARSGFREVYRQFAANFGFWGALALIADASTRWVGVVVLLGMVVLVARTGLAERRESFLLYAVGYGAIGLIWLEGLLFRSLVLTSWIGLATIAGAVVVLMKLRRRLRDSAA